MARRGVILGLGLLVVVAGAVFGSTGFFSSPPAPQRNNPTDAAWHYRQAQPHHWRACMLQQ